MLNGNVSVKVEGLGVVKFIILYHITYVCVHAYVYIHVTISASLLK